MTDKQITLVKAKLEEALTSRPLSCIREAIALLDKFKTQNKLDPPTTKAVTTGSASFTFTKLTHADGPGIVRRIGQLLSTGK